MSLRDWLSEAGGRECRPAKKWSARGHLRLEELEGRLAPAGYAVGAAPEVGRAADLGAAPRQVVFFEPAVAGYQGLLRGLGAGAEAVVLDGARDGLAQMASFLAGRHGLAAVGVVAHGRPGAVELGPAALDGRSLGGDAAELAAVGAALRPGGELDLWSCDVAAGPAGRALVRALAAAAGAGVAASAHEVGAADLGGGWALEARAGGARGVAPFSAGARAAFRGVLGTFQPAAPLSTPRELGTATLLGNGKVLVAGGGTDTVFSVASAELYDATTNTWSPTGALVAARSVQTATLLANGKVLLTGGQDVDFNSLASAELYDPATNSWSPAAPMSHARAFHTATLLNNGKVLVVGGLDNSEPFFVPGAELYDPGSNTWSAAGTLTTGRDNHTATLLGNGKVLVVGGDDDTSTLASAELYDPVSNSWSPGPSLNTARDGHTATLLGNGKVLVAAGANNNGPLGFSLSSAELYDPVSNTWSPAAPLRDARVLHTATALANGKVLVAGGAVSNGDTLASAELYDPAGGTWSSAGALGTPRLFHTATLLGNGKVLVAGGQDNNFNALSSAELYVGAETTTSLTSGPNPSTFGQAVTLTATVQNTSTSATPTGAVEFFDGATDLGAGTPHGGSGGAATWTLATTALDVGGHALRAVYRPADAFLASSGGASQSVVSPHTLTVTTLADGPAGSLRAELALAASGDTVAFADGLSGTIALAGGELQLGTSVAIAGPGAGLLAVSGAGASRVFEVLAGATVSVSGLTVTQGTAATGGGIANGGTLLLSGCVVSGNYASAAGAGLYNAGALRLGSSALFLNSSGMDGGAVYNAAGATLAVGGSTLFGNGALGHGGGLYNAGAAAVTASTVALDSSTLGGGVYNAGALALTASAVYDNGAVVDGGGIYNVNATLTLSNTTVAQNSALGDGAGLWTGGASPGAVTLTNATVAANRAATDGGGGQGGGVFVGAGLPVLHNTLIAGNFSGEGNAARDDVSGALAASSDYNLIGDGTGMTGVGDGVNRNQVGSAFNPIDPLLGPLADNGGPTPTMALLADSPARMGGSTDYAADADQRGLPRVADGYLDIGAYQTQDYGL